MKNKTQAATDWLDANCEDAEASHDFVCRLRNAMMGVNYEEGCPALDFIFVACIGKTTKDEAENKKPDDPLPEGWDWWENGNGGWQPAHKWSDLVTQNAAQAWLKESLGKMGPHNDDSKVRLRSPERAPSPRPLTEDLKGVREKFIKVESIDGERLDDLVHSLAAAGASDLNNKGYDKQIDYIIEQLGEAQALVTLVCIFGTPK